MTRTEKQMLGLSDAEVLASREANGENRFGEHRRVSFLRRMLEGLGDPIIRVLLLAALVRVLFGFSDANWLEIGGILAAVLVSTLVSTASEYGSERAFERLSDEAVAATCRVIRGGAECVIPACELVVGDLLLLSAGETVRADAAVVSGELTVELSALNGESREQERVPGEAGEKYSLDDPHLVFSGSRVTAGSAVVRVLRVGESTYYGALARELALDTRESPLRLRLSHLARQISRIGYIAAALVAVFYLLRVLVIDVGFDGAEIMRNLQDAKFLFSSLLKALTLAITVVVVAVPEGLPMMITVVLSSNMKRMLRDRVLVKKLVGIETAGSINLLFTDKTGTLTEGRLSLSRIVTGEGSERALSTCRREAPALVRLLSLSACLGGEGGGGNATDRALLSALGTPDGRLPRVTARLPFRSERKFSAVAFRDAPALYRGAPEYLLPSCTAYFSDDGKRLPLDRRRAEALWEAYRAAAARGERVIAVAAAAETMSSLASLPSLTLVALLTLSDRIRRDAKSTVARMRRAGIGVVMITGDSPETAGAIAAACGLLSGERDLVLTAARLSEMTDAELTAILPRLAVVARAVPQDKTRLVRVAEEAGLVVGMTGDGVNDAPALRLSDVGFAMGSGTDVAKEAGDIVLLDNSIASIANAVLYGRTIFSSIRKFITFQLMMNLAAVGVSLFGEISGIGSPISIIRMLWVNLIMDTLGGLAFAGEPPLESAMREPPKRRDERILNGYMLGQIAVTGGTVLLFSILFLVSPFTHALFDYGTNPDAFGTAFFVFFILAGLAGCFCARTERLYLFAHLGKNRAFIAIMMLILVIQLAMIYLGGAVFRTVPLAPITLLRIFLLSLAVIPADLFRKFFWHLSSGRRGF